MMQPTDLNGHPFTPAKALIDADTRVVYLTNLCLSLRRDVTAYGEAGFMQMAWDSTAPAAWRRRRAAKLLQARRAKLFNGCSIAHRIVEAAQLREFEKEAPVNLLAEVQARGMR